MGSYELTAGTSTNITWKNCTQSNMFQEDGSIKSGGMMGTNYCKNLRFENMFVCSFDAHCGTYNATLIDSTCEHINFIGEGDIVLKNVTMHSNAGRSGLVLRSDYGSTWQGNVYIDGLTLKYYSGTFLELINAQWANHFFGYQTYLPENIYMNNVKTVKIGYDVDANGERLEWVEATNEMPLEIYHRLNYNYDIGDPNTDMSSLNPTEDKIQCSCPDDFIDSNGDLRCDACKKTDDKCVCRGFIDEDTDTMCDTCNLPEVGDYSVNRNPYIPTKNIYITNCPGLTVIFPNTPQFKDMKVYIDGEPFDWRVDGFIKLPEAAQ